MPLAHIQCDKPIPQRLSMFDQKRADGGSKQAREILWWGLDADYLVLGLNADSICGQSK